MTRRILLIEDEPISQDIIHSLLTGQGYVVDVATDGFSALDRAKAVRYDAALIDYHLPEMDGYALGRLLREQRLNEADAPVLIGLTADRNGLAARRGADAVFRAILPKPIKPSELFETIERLCGGNPPRAGAGSPPVAVTSPDSARRAAARLWRDHGLARPPRAFVCPAPAADQIAALALCFDLVAADQAELVLLLERHGIGEARRAAPAGGERRALVVGLSHDHADICDAVFEIDTIASWRDLAALLSPAPVPTCIATGVEPGMRQPVLDKISTDAQAAKSAGGADLPDIRNDLRAIILRGISTPLSALRAGLTAVSGMAEAIAALDRALLAAGAISDFLTTPSHDAAEASGFDPAEMIGNTIAMLSDAAMPGRPRLTHVVAASVPKRVRGDIHRLNPIVLTLLDDACSFHGSGALSLSATFTEGARSELVLTLTHEPSKDADAPGSGWSDAALVGQLRAIRLATLGRLVSLIGGTLTADEGVLFRLAVPVLSETDPQTASGSAADVLLVDDGATSGQLLTLLLTQGGHRVCRVDDIDAALFACEGAAYDVLLFDIANGSDARKHAMAALRRFQEARTGLPTLVLTSAFSPQEAELAGLGINHRLTKPFAPETLMLAIAQAHRASDVEAIDTAVRDALTQALGPASVGRLTRQLLSEIAALCDDDIGAIQSAAAARLVELSSAAAVLGLTELAQRCAAFETVGSGAAESRAAGLATQNALARTQGLIATGRAA